MTQKPSSKAICHTDKMYVDLNLNYEVPIKSSKQSEICGCTTYAQLMNCMSELDLIQLGLKCTKKCKK